MRGGVFYPPPQSGAAPSGQQPQSQPAQSQQQATPVAAAGAPPAPAPRARKPLVITVRTASSDLREACQHLGTL
jgi:hypothetical protein